MVETLSVTMNVSQDHQVENCISSILPKECSPPEASKVWHTFWEGYLAIIVGVFGVAGNTLSIAVLLDGLLLDLFDRMLLCLAICDITFLGKQTSKFGYFHVGKSYIPTYEQDLCQMQYFSFFSYRVTCKSSKGIPQQRYKYYRKV